MSFYTFEILDASNVLGDGIDDESFGSVEEDEQSILVECAKTIKNAHLDADGRLKLGVCWNCDNEATILSLCNNSWRAGNCAECEGAETSARETSMCSTCVNNRVTNTSCRTIFLNLENPEDSFSKEPIFEGHQRVARFFIEGENLFPSFMRIHFLKHVLPSLIKSANKH